MSVEISRREFLRATVDGLLYTGVAGAGLVAVGVLSQDKMVDQVKKIVDDVKEKEKTGQLLGVKDHSIYVYAAANQIISNDTNPLYLAGGFFTGVSAGSYFLEPDPDTKERVIGSGSALIARSIDTASTVYFSQFMADPRFKEYGLDAYFKEQNPTTSENPTPEEAIKDMVLPTGLIFAVSAINPRIGTGLLGLSPFLAMNNYQIGRTIEECLRLGDGVKMVINDGGTKEDVIDYLKFEVDAALNPQE